MTQNCSEFRLQLALLQLQGTIVSTEKYNLKKTFALTKALQCGESIFFFFKGSGLAKT